MVVCSLCARIALEPFPDEEAYPTLAHDDSILLLLRSAESCPLCQYFLSLFTKETVSNFEHEAEQGIRTRAVLRAVSLKQPLETENRIIKREFVLVSPTRDAPSSERFVIGSSAGSIENRPIWTTPTAVTVPLRTLTIKEWIHTCFKDHQSCAIPSLDASSAPALFIDVGTDGMSTRLVNTDTIISAHDFSYTALSHCWGESGIPFRATSANLEALKHDIPSASLTPTFRDAISITRLLGIRYLWIDALCIIQDDKADWEHEAAKMASVFRCAHVTLAAASPEAKVSGLELTDLAPSTQFQVGPQLGDESRNLRIISRPPEAIGIARLDLLKRSPMHKRGWIFQEMVLSSRIVHFVDGQFFWQCQSIFESEDRTVRVTDREVNWALNSPSYPNHLVSNDRTIDGPLASSKDVTEDFTWWAWVLEHSRRKLTNPDDDLPSLAGAVNFYRGLSGDEPVIGLWMKDLAFHLGWQVVAKDRVRSREPGQPTWSWTSIPHPYRDNNLGIRHLPLANPPYSWDIIDLSTSGFGYRPPAHPGMVVMWSLAIASDGVTIRWAGEPYVSRLLHAELRIQRSRLFDDDNGFLDGEATLKEKLRSKPAQRSEDESDSDMDEVRSEPEWYEGIWNEWDSPQLLFDSAAEEEAADPEKLIALPIWIRHRYESEDLGQYYFQDKSVCYIFEVCSLLLLPVERESNKYRRVGLSTRLFDCHDDDLEFDQTRSSLLRKVEESFESIVLV